MKRRAFIGSRAVESDFADPADVSKTTRPTGSLTVHIHTLGGFSIQVRGETIGGLGKSQRRPLSLLQALIAQGGYAVSGVKLSEFIWSDSEGDFATRNLTITLHRLRHLLDGNRAVLHHESKLSLNRDVCWVDVWEFERLVNDALHVPPMARDGAWEASMRQALGLYKGHFLELEAEEAWMLEPRARWKIKFERATAALSGHLEREQRFRDAIDVCLQSLEIDPCNELLHRRLMACYLKHGEPASAVRAYAECRDILKKGLGARPSEETEVLYRSAMEQGSSPGVRVNTTTSLSMSLVREI